jgi:sugar phosphate isomerase/epimerase
LDGVEFFTAEYTVSQCKEIRMLASDAGLSVDFHAAWDGSNDFGMTPPQKGFTHLEQALARTHLMGGRHLVVHLGRYDLDDPDGRRRALDRVIEITVRIVPALEDSRVLLCWEDNTLCHDLNPLGDQPEDFTRLFSAVQSEFVGMTLDTGHAHVTGYTRAYLEQFGNRVYYVHVNDNDGFGDLHIAPASGSIEWKGLMEQLAYYGASPCFGIEFNEQHVDFELPHLRALADALQWRG